MDDDGSMSIAHAKKESLTLLDQWPVSNGYYSYHIIVKPKRREIDFLVLGQADIKHERVWI